MRDGDLREQTHAAQGLADGDAFDGGGKVLVKLMVWVVIYWVAGDAIRKMGL